LNDPNNYRSLAIEDPILKIFTTLICHRLTEFCENHSLLPTFQFGFRKHLSTASAISTLKACIEHAFKRKKRLFACFVDYKKAFDLVDRASLCEKLQLMGVPTQFAKLIFDILAGIRFLVRSNEALSPPFQSFNGVPQGDPMSPLLYTLYTGDLPGYLSHKGAALSNNFRVRYLLYADDLLLLAETPNDLQLSLNDLMEYARKFQITVNVTKTKCMIFYKGVPGPRSVFLYDGTELEQCNEFNYLGVIFTTRLSASKHVDQIISKCNTRIGYLFSKVPLKEIPLNVAVDLFRIYVLPIISYCCPVWITQLTDSCSTKLNSIFTKFLKRYLGLPYLTNNAIVHFITKTRPLRYILNETAVKGFYKIVLPNALDGINIQPPVVDNDSYDAFQGIPSYFLEGNNFLQLPLPILPEPRRAILYEKIDLVHFHLCNRREFHLEPDFSCRCRFCGNNALHYHHRDCYILGPLSPCALLRKVQSAAERNRRGG
jgi:hypothetical protein